MWAAPSPLWGERSLWIRLPQQDIPPQPIILRFANDAFMEELLATLTHSPWRLSDWIAQPETWREPMSPPKPIAKTQAAPAVESLYEKLPPQHHPLAGQKPTSRADRMPAPLPYSVDGPPIKLFQAAHHRYYVVAASLITEACGYPDYSLNLSNSERVTFMVRALVPASNGGLDEYAFVSTPAGMAWEKAGPYKSSNSRKLIPGEEQLPLFPVAYQGICDHHRQIYSGLIPVGKREEWVKAPACSGNVGDEIAHPVPSVEGGMSHLKGIFQADVTEPWKALIDQAQYKKGQIGTGGNPFPNFGDIWDADKANADKEQAIRTARDQIQTGSWYVLLDLAKFLKEYLPDIWTAMVEASPQILTPVERSFYDLLSNTRPPQALVDAIASDQTSSYGESDIGETLLTALVAIAACENDLEKVVLPFDRTAPPDQWPDFLFPLADPDPALGINDLSNSTLVPSVLTSQGSQDAESLHEQLDALADLVDSLLPSQAIDPERVIQIGDLPLLDQRNARFVIRYAFERPNCGFLFPAIVSEPTRQIEMAPFFDPDAPARAIRIPLPVDISPAGLRKYKKNATFLISDMLCGKIKEIKKLTLADLVLSVLPWPFHKGLPDIGKTGPCSDDGVSLGMFCSLSIPIVTLCALILLIIIVSLFDMFFKWLPYLFICLPIPRFGGKE